MAKDIKNSAKMSLEMAKDIKNSAKHPSVPL